jgi:hypothetical protein
MKWKENENENQNQNENENENENFRLDTTNGIWKVKQKVKYGMPHGEWRIANEEWRVKSEE